MKIPWRRDRLPTPVFFGLPCGSAGKESTCNAGDLGSIPGSGRSPGEGIGYPLQYSWAPLVAQLVKNLPAMQETWVQSLGWEDPLEKGRLPTPIFWPGDCPWDGKESDTTEQPSLSFLLASVRQVVDTKEKCLKEIKKRYSSEHMNDKKAKQPFC